MEPTAEQVLLTYLPPSRAPCCEHCTYCDVTEPNPIPDTSWKVGPRTFTCTIAKKSVRAKAWCAVFEMRLEPCEHKKVTKYRGVYRCDACGTHIFPGGGRSND